MRKIALTALLVVVASLVLMTRGSKGRPAKHVAGHPVLGTLVTMHGAVPDDGKDDTRAFESAIAACRASKNKALVIPAGQFEVGSLHVPSGITVQAVPGAKLNIAAKKTVKMNGSFQASLHQVFTGNGNIEFAVGAVSEVRPQWWGASAKSTDCSPAINAAINSAPAVPGLCVRLSGVMHCRTTIHVDRHRVRLQGDGMYATQLVFDPPKPTTLIEFKHRNKNGILVQCGVRDLSLLAAGKYPGKDRTQKTGIRIVDADIFELRNVAIHNWGGNQSIGIHIQGRQLIHVDNVTVLADLPIFIDKNPAIKWISIDHSTFRNTYLLPMDREGPSVKIASGVALHNVVFDGTHAWVGGKYGLYWEDQESRGVAINLTIKNVRMENGTRHGGEMIHIAHKYGLHNLIIENIYGCGGGVGGIYLRRCTNVTMKNIYYTPVRGSAPADYVPTALDIDESCRNVALMANFWNGGHVKTGKLVKTFGTHSNPSRYNNRIIEVYDAPNNDQGDNLLVYGTKTWSYNGKVASQAELKLPITSKNSVALVHLAVSDGKKLNEAATFMVGGQCRRVSGTARTSDTLKSGKLCLISGKPYRIVNRLGKDVHVVVTAHWKP